MAGYIFGCSSSRGPSLRLEDFYELGGKVSEQSAGGSSEVVRGTRHSDGSVFAVKIVCIDDAREDRSQIDALKVVNHSGIIKMVDWFETPDMLYIVMDLALGGELFDRISQGVFSEKNGAATFRQLLEAVGHLHSRGIVHCDLKPENIIYEHGSADSKIKIADFGFAQFLPGGTEGADRLYKEVGTLSYASPEVLAGTGYGTKADMWSLGVILYVMMSGVPPFGKRKSETDRDVRRNIESGNWRFYESHFTNVSYGAKDLIRRLIVVDPALRLSWEQALEHDWIKDNAPEEEFPDECAHQLANLNESRGSFTLPSHALAGVVSSTATPDVMATVSTTKPESIPRLFCEGSIQPVISLAYSKSYIERKNGCIALANLALRKEYQVKIICEGGLRRLNQLAVRDNQCSDIKFFCALALARLAEEGGLRERMLEGPEDSSPTLAALLHLAQPPPANPTRAQRKASDALALLSMEEKLHEQLVAAGVLPVLVRQAQAGRGAEEARDRALRALAQVLDSATRQPRNQGSVSVEHANNKLNGLFFSAQDAKLDQEATFGGLAALVSTLEEQELFSELLAQEGQQPWHDARGGKRAAKQLRAGTIAQAASDFANHQSEGEEEEELSDRLSIVSTDCEQSKSRPEEAGAEAVEAVREHVEEAHELLRGVLGKDYMWPLKRGWECQWEEVCSNHPAQGQVEAKLRLLAEDRCKLVIWHKDEHRPAPTTSQSISQQRIVPRHAGAGAAAGRGHLQSMFKDVTDAIVLLSHAANLAR